MLEMCELFFKGQSFKQLQTWVSVSHHFLIEREEETEGTCASVTCSTQRRINCGPLPLAPLFLLFYLFFYS